MANDIEPLKEKLYQEMLKDDNFRCTCDESSRENEFHPAEGHYHKCMLYQVTRALNKVDKVVAAVGTAALETDNILKMYNRGKLFTKDVIELEKVIARTATAKQILREAREEAQKYSGIVKQAMEAWIRAEEKKLKVD